LAIFATVAKRRSGAMAFGDTRLRVRLSRRGSFRMENAWEVNLGWSPRECSLLRSPHRWTLSTVYKNGGANREFYPQGINSPLTWQLRPWGQSLPLRAKLRMGLCALATSGLLLPEGKLSSVCTSILLINGACSSLEVNERVTIPPRGQSSLLITRFTPRGELGPMGKLMFLKPPWVLF
jgi:hypothetical protein